MRQASSTNRRRCPPWEIRRARLIVDRCHQQREHKRQNGCSDQTYREAASATAEVLRSCGRIIRVNARIAIAINAVTAAIQVPAAANAAVAAQVIDENASAKVASRED